MAIMRAKDVKEKKPRKVYKVDDVKLLALPITNDKIVLDVYKLNFPYELFRKASETKSGETGKSLQCKELNNFLMLNIAGILYTGYINVNTIKKPWLYAIDKVSEEYIKCLLTEWAKKNYSIENAEELIGNLKWERYKLELSFIPNENGTANPSPEAYDCYVRYLGFMLSETLEFDVNGSKIHFYVANTGKGVELISWEPFKYNSKGIISYWSYRIKITLQTVPLEKRAYLYLHTGVLRWQKNEKLELRDEQDSFKPYILNMSGFSMGSGKTMFIRTSFSGKRGWDYRFRELLKISGLQDKLPYYENLMNYPLTYFNNKDYFNICIPFGSHFEGKHQVKSGAGLIDRVVIAKKVKEVLANNREEISPDFVTVKKLIECQSIPN